MHIIYKSRMNYLGANFSAKALAAATSTSGGWPEIFVVSILIGFAALAFQFKLLAKREDSTNSQESSTRSENNNPPQQEVKISSAPEVKATAEAEVKATAEAEVEVEISSEPPVHELLGSVTKSSGITSEKQVIMTKEVLEKDLKLEENKLGTQEKGLNKSSASLFSKGITFEKNSPNGIVGKLRSFLQ